MGGYEGDASERDQRVETAGIGGAGGGALPSPPGRSQGAANAATPIAIAPRTRVAGSRIPTAPSSWRSTVSSETPKHRLGQARRSTVPAGQETGAQTNRREDERRGDDGEAEDAAEVVAEGQAGGPGPLCGRGQPQPAGPGPR